MADELILHHYPMSPFSEKVRLALGLKGIAWRSLEVNWILPRPYTTPLTGGFRRIPVLQIGADVYCDTQVIATELERRYPEPTLFPNGSAGLARMLGGWSDSRFFTAAMTVALGGMGHKLPDEFIADREAMAGSRFNLEKMRAGLPVMQEQLRAQIDWIDTQLADGRAFLFGDAPGWGDINAYFNCWFIRNNCPSEAGMLDDFEYVPQWERRIATIGHGQPATITGNEALAVAREAEAVSQPDTDPGEPNGLRSGERVALAADDYAKDTIVGELVSSSARHIAIALADEQVGRTVAHFPRAGYTISRV